MLNLEFKPKQVKNLNKNLYNIINIYGPISIVKHKAN